MGKLIVSEFITLDGVIENPGGSDLFVERGADEPVPTFSLTGNECALPGCMQMLTMALTWAAWPHPPWGR